MVSGVEIRPERPGEAAAIRALAEAAFADMEMSDGSEPGIVDGLRRDGDLSLSLVAVEGAEFVWHVAFSPVAAGAADRGWYGLGPLSVRPERQGRGIGGALVREGLRRLQAEDAAGCALVGDPGCYARFGFRSGGLGYGDVPRRYVLALSFGGATPSGSLTYRPAFGQDGPSPGRRALRPAGKSGS